MPKSNSLKTFLLLFTFVFFSLPASADSDDRVITVTASAIATAAPDMATVRVSFIENGPTVKPLSERSLVNLNELLDSLKSIAKRPGSLDNSQISINPQYSYKNDQRNFIGYEVNRKLSFTMTDLGQLGTALKLISDAEVAKLNSIEFGLQDESSVRDQALDAAIKLSKEKAQRLADGYGVKLKSLQSAEHQTEAQQTRSVYSERAMLKMADQAPPKQEDLRFRAQVRANFSIK